MTTAISSQQATTTWTIDSAHSLVEFSAKHIMITTVKGRFADFRGTITLDAHQPAGSSVAVEIATPSLDTHNDQRDQHLRAAEFLEVEKHPLITFRSRGVEGFSPTEGNKFRLVGDLTIRGVTREIVLDATYEGQGRDPWGGDRVSFAATTKIDRREFGLTWNAALETGGVLVSNEIKINLEIQAIAA